MKYNLIVTFSLLVLCCSTTTSAETWFITEGHKPPYYKGEWAVAPNKADFPCAQSIESKALTAKCTVIKSGNFVAVRKRQVSDGNDCNYFGERTGNSIDGTYFCKSGGSYNWTAKISP